MTKLSLPCYDQDSKCIRFSISPFGDECSLDADQAVNFCNALIAQIARQRIAIWLPPYYPRGFKRYCRTNSHFPSTPQVGQ